MTRWPEQNQVPRQVCGQQEFHISRRWINRGKNIPPFPLADLIVLTLSTPFLPRIPSVSSAIELSLTHARPNTRKMATPSTRRRWRKEARACVGDYFSLQVPGEGGRKRQRVGLVDLLKGCLMPVRDPAPGLYEHRHAPTARIHTQIAAGIK